MKKKIIHNSDFQTAFKYFFGWRVFLFVVAFFAVLFIPVFGNRFPYAERVLSITNLPNWVWGFGNFDGVHYLRIAQNGYTADFTQAFFPVFPLLIRIFNIFPKSTGLDLSLYTDPSYFLTGMILTSVFFITALYFLAKLWREEYGKGKAVLSVLLLLSFPTAFYFGSVYTESLFLLLTVLIFWLVKKNNFLLAGIVTALVTATKIQGIALVVFLCIELWKKHYIKGKKQSIKNIWKDLIGIIISPAGLIAYMFYLKQAFGSYFYFLTSLPAYGSERSSLPIITLPQVFYRYIKMLLTSSPANLAFWNASLEFLVTILLVAGLVFSYKKLKFSYWIYVLITVLIPTLTGTLTSMPRYALLAFPLIPLITVFNKATRYIIIAQILLGIVLLSLFARGYWVA